MRLPTLLPLLASLALATPLFPAQSVLSTDPHHPPSTVHTVDASILSALEAHADPVDALLSLRPGLEEFLDEKRLLDVRGVGEVWMTEGDKLRLRREGRKFVDVTGLIGFDLGQGLMAGKAHMPNITHQRFVKPCLPEVSTEKMHDVLTHMTSFYNRYYHSTHGAMSARWLHDHVADIISNSPFGAYISLSYHTHTFLQPSVIARFEPPVTNISLPLTIIGAHQDSANYLFPLLPAPGADDDCSGTVSILEAFRVLATRGYIPETPVEFHWYAAEEAGLLGSQAIAMDYKGAGKTIGAMLEFDMTAFIAKGADETIGFIRTEADSDLTDWAVGLSKEYISIPTFVHDLDAGAGSDYMSFTKLGYPAAFAAEGDPTKNGFPGEFDPYVHTTGDKMDIDDSTGVFSLDHMARFSELAIAFIIEQAGWSDKHTRSDDRKHQLWD